MSDASDPYDLQRFVDAQQTTFARAHAELRDGCKRSHWMWYIFPQLEGLGTSPVSLRYAIESLDEAVAYLAHPVLGSRLTVCADAVLATRGRTARQIFGTPDDLKLRSCATLFARVPGASPVFQGIIDTYFGGKACERTRRTLDAEA